MKHNWTYKKLGEVAKSDLGKTLNHSTDKGNLYPYLCAVNVLWDRIDLTIIKQTKFEPYELERYSVQKGDLLICEGGDTGRAAIWEREEPMLYQNALHRVRFNSDVNARFVLYFLRHLKDIGDIDLKYSKGVTIKHLVKSSLMSIPLPIPSLDEQQAIVRELDGINRLIDLQEEQLREYDRLAQSLFYTTFGDPITNPKGWEVKSLGEVGRVITGNTPSTRDANNYASSDVCFFKPSDFDADQLSQLCESEFKISNYAYEQSRKLPKGAILTTCIGIVGKVGILKTDATCNQQINAIIPNELTESYYLGYAILLIKNLLSEKANAPVVPLLNKSQFSAVCIPVPPLDLQQSFADQIEAIEQQKALVRRSLDDTRTLLAARMQYYFE